MNYGYAKLAEIYNVNEFCTCNFINNKHIIRHHRFISCCTFNATKTYLENNNRIDKQTAHATT